MKTLRMTAHATERAADRSIRMDDLEMFERFADLEISARNGATHLRLSKRGAVEARKAGIDDAQIARMIRLNLVESEGNVLTIYRCPAPTIRRRNFQDGSAFMEAVA